MNIVQKTIQVTVKFVSQGLDKINKQIDGLNKKTNQFTRSTNDTVKAQKDLNKETEKLNKNLKTTQTSTAGASKAKRTFASSVGRAISIVAQFTIAMQVVNGVIRIAQFLTIDAAKAAMQFESSLKSLQAIANVSSSDLEKFKDVIFDVAGSTRFTASEIAELQKELSRLGFTTEEVIASTEAIARFAEAIGVDLGTAAQFVGKQLQAFGLNASSAFEITNAFTALINNSALSMETLATSMQYASSISATLGVSVEETGALLGVLTNNGITASRAGTGLRQIFLELGADGGTLTGILDDLASQNITLSEAEELVGKRAAGALSILIDQREEIGRLIDAQDTLVASTIASARQNSTFEAQIQGLKAATDKLLISLGNWITKTEVVLELIELLGGGTTYRAFNVVDQLGLSSDEIEASLDNLDALNGAFEDTIDYVNKRRKIVVDEEKIQEVFGVSAERAKEIGDNMKKLIEDDSENLPAFVQYMKDLNAEVTITQNALEFAGEKTSDYKSKIDELAKSAKKGTDIEKDRTSLLNELSEARRRVNERLEGSIPLNEQERANLEKQEEVLGQLLSRLRNISIEKEKEAGKKDKFANLTTEEELLEAITKREAAQKEIVKALNDETVSVKKRAEAYSEFKILQEEIAEIEKKRAEIYGKGEEQEVRTTQELVEEFKKLNDELELANELGDVVGVQKATKALMELSDEIAKSGRGREFLTVYDRILGKEQKEKNQQRLEDARKEVERINNEAEKWLGEQADLDKAFGELGFLGKLLYGSSDKKPDETQEEFTKRMKDTEKLIFEQTAKIADAGMDAAFDATNRRLEAEQAAVDARYTYEEDRLQSLLDSNLITQAEYERKREQLERERIKKTNEVEKKQFEADKARALVDIAIDTARAIVGRGLEPIQTTIILAASAIQAGIVSSQKFVPVKFEEGGLVEGKSNAQGGFPLSFINIPSGAAQSAIVASQKFVPVKFEEGGLVEGNSHTQVEVPFKAQGIGGYEMEGGEHIVKFEEGGLVENNSHTEVGVPFKVQGVGEYEMERGVPIVKFEQGGLVNGKSHAQGGVPFKVKGVGGYEMEGGEYIVNKKATAKYLPVLEQLNSYGRVNNSMFKHFAQGGMVGDTLGTGESSRINELLLKRLDQPIRAYVSENELMTKTNERINQKRKSAL